MFTGECGLDGPIGREGRRRRERKRRGRMETKERRERGGREEGSVEWRKGRRKERRK